jgi:TonB-linked SusC/RagA family outer membrane protein
VVDKNTVQTEDLTIQGLFLPPDAPPIFNPDGSLNWAPLSPGARGTWTNPYAELNDKYVSNTSNLVSNAIVSYAVLKGLEVKVSMGYTNTQTGDIPAVPTTAYDPARDVTSGHSYLSTVNTHSWIIEPQADYKLQLGRGVFTVLTGASFLENNSSYVYEYASDYVSDALLEDLQAAGSVSVNSSSSAQYKYEAVFGRLGYDWMDKYLLNITARRDGTTRFGPGRQFGNFGAVGAGWIFTKEDFIQKNVGFLSFGKLRGSYGTTGNDQVGDYQFIDLYSPTGYPYQGSQGLYPTNLFNANLAWETTKKLEGGIELGFLKDRIMVQASLYQNRTGNELVQTPVSEVTGFSTIASNLPALVQNTGKEFVLTTTNLRTKNFGWSTSLNLTIARNKLLSFPNLSTSPYASTLVIGQPLNVLQLYHCIGVNDTTGLYEFASSKTGPNYNPNYLTDRNSLVSLTPKYYGGFQNSVSYKGFSLDIFFQFVKQTGERLWDAYHQLPGTMDNQPMDVLNRWQKPGDEKPYQQFTQNSGSEAASTFSVAKQSDFAYGDASYIRLKNLAISWQMSPNLVKKAGMANIRIYVQGQNLLTFTKYDGMDPESQSAYTGPRRAFVTGVQLGW